MRRLTLFLFLIIFSATHSYAQDSIQETPLTQNDDILKPLEHDVVLGEENAPITVIEYASLSCSHCAAFHNNTFNKIKEQYIDTGKVKFIFRNFPLDQTALTASLLATCGGKEKFHTFTKVLFSTQANWAGKKNYKEILVNIGKLGGLTSEEIQQCFSNKDSEQNILKSKFDAHKTLEVNSTPTFFINGEKHSGARGFSYYENVFNTLLNINNETDQIKNQKKITN